MSRLLYTSNNNINLRITVSAERDLASMCEYMLQHWSGPQLFLVEVKALTTVIHACNRRCSRFVLCKTCQVQWLPRLYLKEMRIKPYARPWQG